MLSELFFSMLSVCCIGAVIFSIIRCCICLIRHQKIDLKKEIPIVLFFAYCAGLFSQTIPIYTKISDTVKMVNGIFHSINLIPFKTIVEYFTRRGSLGGISLANVLGNILLFIPMGLLLPLVFKRCNKVLIVVLIGAMFSVLIEGLQYFLGRSADIDDVILNTTGTAIGFAIYGVIICIIKKNTVNRRS